MIRFSIADGRLPAVLSNADLTRTGKVVSTMLRIKRPTEVGIRFVSPREIQRLNKAFRKKDRPTDVLSFPTSSDSAFPQGGAEKISYLGDIALCASYATTEARRRSIQPREELIRLLVHGILHLKGYDHATETEELRMFGLQERAVESIIA